MASSGSSGPADRAGRPRAAGRAIYGGLPESGPPGFAPRLLEFADELRGEGLAVGTSELLDAFHALHELSWTKQEDFREALAATIAKSQEDRRVFELVFDRFFFRAVEREAVERGLREERYEGGDRLDFDDLRERIREAVRAGSDGEMRDMAQLKRRLATRGHEQGGRRRSAVVDVRRTMRASLETGGVPMRLRFRHRRPRRPEVYVLCDVSTSVTSASVFFLSVLHALHDAFRRMRSFVFVERISEVTDVFERERSFKAVSDAISKDAGVADVSGYTDYGRVWNEFLSLVEDDLHPRATVIVLGDARTNGRDPRADVFAGVAEHSGRTFWLNPEPRLYWNYGDSVIAAYEPFCEAHECWTTKQLEDFVKALTRPERR